MIIQIDSREKRNNHITAYFDEQGIEYFVSKMYIGDYCRPDNTVIVIERKKDLQEFAGNCGSKHGQFKAELERLDKLGGKMYILIEQPYSSLDEIQKWKNRHRKYRVLKNGQRKDVTMDGWMIYCIAKKWIEKHNIEFIFCRSTESGEKIIELLEG